MSFTPAAFDYSSIWNDNQQQQQAHSNQVMTSGGDADVSHDVLPQPSVMAIEGALPDDSGGGGTQVEVAGLTKPVSMAELARLARIPLLEPGLKCPRCDSTSTNFSYFNNYSLSQPRYLCRACRRYWTRGGKVRNVAEGRRSRRSGSTCKGTKAKPKAAAPSYATTNAPALVPSPAAPAMPAMLGGGSLCMLPPLLTLAELGAMSIGSRFSGMGEPSVQAPAAPGACSIGGSTAGGGAGLEQWAAAVQQVQSFPFLQAIDQLPPLGPPLASVATVPRMPAHLGLDSGDERGGRGTSTRGDGSATKMG